MVEKCSIVARTQEEAESLLHCLEDLGCRWMSGELPTENLLFSPLNGGTTYYVSDIKANRIARSGFVDKDADYNTVDDFIASHDQIEAIAINVMEIL